MDIALFAVLAELACGFLVVGVTAKPANSYLLCAKHRHAMHDSHAVADHTACRPHDRLMCSHVAGRSKAVELAYNRYEWLYKSWAVTFDGSACRGAIWLPSLWLCRMCRPRTIARSTSLSACSACVVRGRYLRLSRASRGFRESSSASETDSG